MPPSGVGALVEGDDRAPRILDGVDYSLPVVLSRQSDAALGGKRDAYLREAVNTTYRFQFDNPYHTDELPFEPVTEDPLREWAWSTRERVLTNTHAAYQRNPIANRGCKYFSNFTIGEGFNLTCRNKDVEKILQAFIDDPDNEVRTYERQAVIDLLVDGELMLRWYSDKNSIVMAPMRPWECQYIKTEAGFFRRRISYRFNLTPAQGDDPTAVQGAEQVDVPAAEMLHVAINRHGYELRGRPELYPILPWLKAYKDWLENRARQNYWRGALVFWISVKNAAAPVLAAVAARWRKPPSPGSVAVETENVTVNTVTNPVAAGDASEDGRQIKLMSAVGLGLPEYFLGDGNNSNLASATKQQLPALTSFGEFQDVLVEMLWTPAFKRVLTWAIENGQLPAQVEEQDADGDPVLYDDPLPTTTPAPIPGEPAAPVLPRKQSKRMIDTLDAFDVAYAPIQGTDIVNIAQAMNMALMNNLASRETASTEMGFDYGIEKKRIERERMADMDDMQRGIIPTPPEMGGADAEDEGTADAEPEKAAG